MLWQVAHSILLLIKHLLLISSFTWFYVPAVAKDSERGLAVAEYLRWVYTSGEKLAEKQGYSPLPEDLLARVMTKAATVR